MKAALTNMGIPKVEVAVGASGDGLPEVDISDDEYLQFDTSGVPVIVTLTKVAQYHVQNFLFSLLLKSVISY